MRLSWSRAEDGVVTVYGTSSDGRICEIADFWLKPMVDRFGAPRATALDWQQQAAEVLVNNWNRLFTAANIPVTQIPPLEAAVVSLTLENAKLRDALAERQEITMTEQDTAMLTKNTNILRKEVAAHIAADALIKGSYWDAKRGKGCFIGCLTHSANPAPAFERFGLPVAVLRIAENIFEALPKDKGKAFFAALPDAVGRDGKDLSRVHWAFLAAELRALPKTTDAVQAVIDPVIAGMDLLAAGKPWPKDAAYAAADAAYAAANAANADANAYAAADAAYAANAAYAAAYAAYAAYAANAAYAAYAAAYAAADAAYAAYAANAAAYAANAANAAADAANAAADAANAAAYAANAAADAANAAADAANAAAYAANAAARLRQRDTLLALIAAA